MLLAKNKLQLRHYKHFFNVAQKRHTKHFVLFIDNSQQEVPKVTVIVPASKVSSAVKRNQTKRVVSVALAKLINSDKIESPINLVVYCKQSMHDFSSDQVALELKTKL